MSVDSTAAFASVSITATATWDELVSAALLGSERGGRSGSISPTELLDAAAELAVGRRVGAHPIPFALAPDDVAGPGPASPDSARSSSPQPQLHPHPIRPAPMPPDPRPLISPAAALRLRSILDGHRKYLSEWLAVARATGCRIPSAFFPELLDLTRNNAQIRSDVTILLGEPGRWLAGLNRSWAFFLEKPSPSPAPTAAPTSTATPPVPDFTAEARRLLARAKNSNDLYNLVMRQPGLWPEEGSRLLIEYVAAHRFTVATHSAARSSDWAIEQLQRTIGDHAPLHLREVVSALIAQEPALLGGAPANPVVDLREILDALSYRADMHRELTNQPRTAADPEGRQR
jgi:hypothetical protein